MLLHAVVFHAARRGVRTIPDAEDVASEALLRSWTEHGNDAVGPQLKGWAVRVAKNLAADKRRAAQRSKATPADLEQFPSPVVLGRLERNRLRRQLAEILRTIRLAAAAPERRIMNQLANGVYNNELIARALGVSSRTVRRSRRRLEELAAWARKVVRAKRNCS